ncbi:NUDIX hydrolase [Flavobacterium flavipallidum]|uniref:NUDIX hydrolase n=1 Tax=Flavobacterium flavipallidum TaxID=3139140 RepID=A0ABU9HJI1_9FLAO
MSSNANFQTEIIPNISVDCVIFGFDKNTKSLNVLLIERFLKFDDSEVPSVNDYVLKGFHTYENESVDETANRVLKELTGLEQLYKKQFKVFGDPNRLKNEKDIIWAQNQHFSERTITIGYYILLPTDVVQIKNKYNPQWFPINQLPELGFDHKKIIAEAYTDLKEDALSKPIVFELLADKFTIKDLQDTYEAILGVEIDNRNFRRKLITKKYIIALDEKQTGVSKKPSQLYMFSKDVYQKIYKESYLINI